MSIEREMSAAAAALVGDFTDDQRRTAQHSFPSDEERRLWFYTPTDHGGLALGEMTAIQQQSCLRLVASGLSEAGYGTAASIMALENVLDRTESWPRVGERRVRDPFAYSLTLFGDPESGSWAWRFGGHHLSLNVTIVDGAIRSTPSFFGADPASSPLSDGQTLRPLGLLEDRARDLVVSLDPGRLETALLAPVPPLDIVMGNRPRVVDGAQPMGLWEIFRGPPPVPVETLRAVQSAVAENLGLLPEHLEAVRYTSEPRGLPARAMNARQRESLVELVTRYLDRWPDRLAAERRADLRASLNDVYFAWAGSLEPGRPHYYRIQGPRLLIEYDNVQRDANHAHSVVRDPTSDFGDDFLAAHHPRHHSSTPQS